MLNYGPQGWHTVRELRENPQLVQEIERGQQLYATHHGYGDKWRQEADERRARLRRQYPDDSEL